MVKRTFVSVPRGGPVGAKRREFKRQNFARWLARQLGPGYGTFGNMPFGLRRRLFRSFRPFPRGIG